MIGFAEKKDFEQIISLWHDVFGDSPEFVKEYLNRFYNRVLLYREGEEIAGMLSLLDLSEGKKTGYYIYAVATDERYRLRGIASALIEYAKSLCRKDEFLILVPAEDSLFGFYEKLGFSEISCVRKRNLMKTVIDAYLPVNVISPTEFMILRKEFFKDTNFIEWDIDVLNLLHDVFETKFIRLGDNVGFAVCEVFENFVSVKELCCAPQNIKLALSSVCKFFGRRIYSYALPAKDIKPYAMSYGKKFKKPYFNLALD